MCSHIFVSDWKSQLAGDFLVHLLNLGLGSESSLTFCYTFNKY